MALGMPSGTSVCRKNESGIWRDICAVLHNARRRSDTEQPSLTARNSGAQAKSDVSEFSLTSATLLKALATYPVSRIQEGGGLFEIFEPLHCIEVRLPI
jgi:hypothetical protein